MKKVKRIYLKTRIALVNWELRNLELHRRRAVAEFMLATDDGRREAQELHFQRGTYIANRRTVLEKDLRRMKQELKDATPTKPQ